jgi:hypothetical protein
MKKNIIFAFIVFLLLGCAHPVKHKLYGKKYTGVSPLTLAVLPVGGKVESFRVKEIFRTSVVERLRGMGYQVMPSDDVDDVFFKGLNKTPEGMTPTELAALLPTDAVVYVYIKDWDPDQVLGYVSLKFSARFKLISREGKLLWKGKHKTKESGFGFDKKVLELGVLDAYEPRIDRLVDNVISTLPGVAASASAGEEEIEKKDFFKWLPSS